eukprot:439736_1
MELAFILVIIAFVMVPAISSGICQEIAQKLLLDTTQQALKNTGFNIASEVVTSATSETLETAVQTGISSWVPSLGTCVKIGVKVGAVAAFGPFGGLAVDGVSVAVDVASGNYVAAGITVVMSPLNFWNPFPVGSGADEAAKEAAKDAAQDAAVETVKAANKEAIKEISKEAGEEAAVVISKYGLEGVFKQEVIEATKQEVQELAKETTKQAGRSLSKQIASGQIQNALQNTVKEFAEGSVKSALSKTAEETGKKLLQNALKDPANWKLVFEWFMKMCVN